MNQKQLLILIVVLGVLGAGALMLMNRDAQSVVVGSGDSAALVPDLPVGEEVASLVITRGTNTLTLSKQDGVWSVVERDGYPANYTEISRTVLKLRDLKPGQREAVGPTQLARLELLEPGAEEGGGTRVEFRDAKGDVLGALLLGKEQTQRQEAPPSQFGGGGPQEVPVGRWVMNPEKKSEVALVSDTLSNLVPTPATWLNKDFFKVQKIRSIEVTYPEAATNSFKLSRETESGDWTLDGLKGDEELDTTKTSSFNYALSSPSFNDVAVTASDADLGLDQPTLIRIETFEDFVYDIRAGDETDGVIAMRVSVKGAYPREREASEDEDESVRAEKDKAFAETLKTRDEKLEKEQALGKWTYLVSSWTLDSLLKERGELVKVKEAEAEEAEPAVQDPSDLAEDLLSPPPSP